MKIRVKAALTFIIMLAGVITLLAPNTSHADQPEGLHCPDHESYTKSTGNTYVPPAGAIICVKGGPQDATGKITADGKTSVGDYLPGKYDVSYYIVYSMPPETTDPPSSDTTVPESSVETTQPMTESSTSVKDSSSTLDTHPVTTLPSTGANKLIGTTMIVLGTMLVIFGICLLLVRRKGMS